MVQLDIRENIDFLSEAICIVIDQMLNDFQSEAVPNEYYVQACLFERLRAIPLLNRRYSLAEHSSPKATIPVHPELDWFAPAGELGNIPDITILEPHRMQFLPGAIPTKKDPSKKKSYISVGPSMVFETKHQHLKHGQTPMALAKHLFEEIVNKDVKKIEGIWQKLVTDEQSREPPFLRAYFVAFSYVEEIWDNHWEDLKAAMNNQPDNLMSIHLGSPKRVDHFVPPTA